MTTAPDTEAYCELSFSPNVSLIATVRRFVAEFYTRVLNDADVTSRLVVATHELLENAVRYSVDGQSAIRIGVRRADESIHVTIETRNKTATANVAELTALLDEMTSAADRNGFYQVLMKRSSKRQDGSGDLKSTTERDQSTLTARLIGSAENESKAFLDAYLKAIHDLATADAVREVVVDMRGLEFMNSSCIKAFVSWIGVVQDSPKEHQYRLRFLSDSKKDWQSRSLKALACFAADLITVETS